MKSIQEIFPNASADTVAANPHLSATNGGSGQQNDSTGILSAPRVKCGRMNKTESEFALILESMKRKGEILRWEFEGIALRWFDMRYTPDFVVFSRHFEGHLVIKFIEVKGAHVHYSQQAMARFKGARGFWPEFTFEMHQKTKEGWKQII